MARLVIGLVLAFVFFLASAQGWAEDLVVFATSSTAEAITELADRFTAGTTQSITIELGAPGLLVRRIEAGEVPHLILFDGKTWLDRLTERKTLAPDTRRRLFSNRLVLVTDRDFPHTIPLTPNTPLRDLLGDSKFAIADPALDPAGELAQAALQSLNVWQAMTDKLERAPDVRAALALVGRDDLDAGIVYATDAKTSSEVKISGIFLRSMHPPIVYEMALAAGKDSPEARQLHEFLLSREARVVFAAHGFLLE
jgi:molybdate transport system substrate-binding protein